MAARAMQRGSTRTRARQIWSSTSTHVAFRRSVLSDLAHQHQIGGTAHAFWGSTYAQHAFRQQQCMSSAKAWHNSCTFEHECMPCRSQDPNGIIYGIHSARMERFCPQMERKYIRTRALSIHVYLSRIHIYASISISVHIIYHYMC